MTQDIIRLMGDLFVTVVLEWMNNDELIGYLRTYINTLLLSFMHLCILAKVGDRQTGRREESKKKQSRGQMSEKARVNGGQGCKGCNLGLPTWIIVRTKHKYIVVAVISLYSPLLYVFKKIWNPHIYY